MGKRPKKTVGTPLDKRKIQQGLTTSKAGQPSSRPTGRDDKIFDGSPLFFYMPNEKYGQFCQWFPSTFFITKGEIATLLDNKAMRKVLMGTLCRPRSPEKGSKKESGSSKTINAYYGRVWRGRELVEAASRDRIWGIGFTASNALKVEKEQWGQNLLGKALMEVRKRLVEEQIAKGMWEDGGEEEDDEDKPGEEQGEEKNERDEEVLPERDEPARVEGEEKEEGKGKKIDL
ncbi:hypothetical protein QBC37DRAFT_483735 [Rhypophila decipiens]|uniref:NADAR domain-containing protein n=1 Tax=Rhypophila decipiens TaxID=261697 RepID=A0AAN6Y5F9_9PEZI|nr:hypothetical protein QBC37DRAFT_483735 [Rhypophila decipiens]